MKQRMLPLTLLFLLSLPLAVIAQSPRYARVISDNANLREAPSIVATSQQEIPEGTLLKILDEKGPWYIVRVRDKTVIWATQKGDRSIRFCSLKKGGRRKVAERLVNKMKDDLFDNGS